MRINALLKAQLTWQADWKWVPLRTLKVRGLIHWAGTSWNFERPGSYPLSKYILELWKSGVLSTEQVPLGTLSRVLSTEQEPLGTLKGQGLIHWASTSWNFESPGSYPLSMYLLELESPGSYPLSRYMYLLEFWKARVLSTEQVPLGTLKVWGIIHWACTSWNLKVQGLIHWAGTSWNFESLGSYPLSKYLFNF